MNKQSKTLNSNIWLVILFPVLYLFLYNPLLRSGISFATLFLLISTVYAIVKFPVFSRYMHYYKSGLRLMMIMLIYLFVSLTINGADSYSIIKSLFIWILFSTVVPVFLVEEVFVRFKRVSFWEVIIELGFVASLISCLALFYPPFNEFLRNIQMELVAEGTGLENQLEFRAFGFAYLLTSAYPYVQGLIASLCLLKIDKKHKRYAFYILPILISVIINARTGIFPIAMTTVYLVGTALLKIKIGSIIKVVIISGLGLLAITRVLSYFPDLVAFMQDFFEQLSFIFLEEGFEDSAYSKMLFFPETTRGVIFGEGYSVFGLEDQDSSDIGYVNQIFIGGLIFAGLLIIYELLIYFKIVKWSSDKVFPTIFVLSIFIFNYKGVNFYSAVPFTKLWILYYYVLLHNKLYPQKEIGI